jgi:hypothetical protein
MHLDDVAAFFAHVEHVNVAIFTVGMDCLHFVHWLAFDEAGVDFLEVLAEIFVRNEKDSVTSCEGNLRTVGKSLFVFVLDDLAPEIFVAFIPFSVPFIFTPRVSQFEHSVSLVLIVLQGFCTNLNKKDCLQYCSTNFNEVQIPPSFFPRLL